MDRSSANKAKGHHHSWHVSMKTAFDYYVKYIFNHFIKANRDMAFLFISEDSGKPLFCSDKSMKSSECRSLLGYFFLRNLVKYPPEELFDTKKLIPVKDDGSFNTKYTYLALVKDLSKEDAKFEKIPMNSSDYNAVLPKYKDLVEYSVKDSLKIGVLTHASISQFKMQRSRLTENQNDLNKIDDVYEMIGEYAQEKVEWYAEAEASEKAAKLITKKDRDATLKKDFDKLKALYSGTGATLAVADHFYAVQRRHPTGATSVVAHTGTTNMKAAMQHLVARIYATIHAADLEKDTTYIMLGRQSNPIYCNDGDFTKETCRKLLGWAITRNYMYLDRKIVDTKIPGNNIESRYVGYMKTRKDDKIVRLNFTAAHGASAAAFNAAWKSREYKYGLMGHTTRNWWGLYKTQFTTAYAGSNKLKNVDACDLIAEYAQTKHDLYKTAGATSEKDGKYVTVAEKKEARDAAVKKLKALYTGNGDRLNRASILFYVTYDKRYHKLSYGNWRGVWSIKNGYDTLANTLAGVLSQPQNVKYPEDLAWMVLDRRSGPQQCSEKEFGDKACRVMLGYALRQRWVFPHKNVTDIHIAGADEGYQWVSYAWNQEKADSEIKVTPLGKNWGVAVQTHNKQFAGADRNFTTGIIGHTAQRNWWSLITNNTANEKFIDTYEMLGSFYQKQKKIWDKPCSDEKSCGIITKKAYNKVLNGRLDKIKAAYTGKNERLYRNYNFFGLRYHKSTNRTDRFYNQNHYSVQYIYTQFANHVRAHVLAPPTLKGDSYTWMLVSGETGPLFCSDGEDFAAAVSCQRMIGHALQKGWLWAHKDLNDRYMPRSSAKYIHYAIMQKDLEAEPEKVDLEKGLAASQEKFKALLKNGGPEQKYTLGVMGHAGGQFNGFKYPTNTPKLARNKMAMTNDIETMLAVFHQKKSKVFLKEVTNEKDAKLKTRAAMDAKAVAAFEGLKALYKGKGEQLHRSYHFSSFYFDRRSRAIGYVHNNLASNNFRHAFDTLAQSLYNSYLKPYREISWLTIEDDRGVLGCSEEKIDDPKCLKMLGYAIFSNAFNLEKVDLKLVNSKLHVRHPDFYYYALVRNSEKPDEETKRINLTRNWGPALAKYRELCSTRKQNPTPHNVCVLGSTRQNHWWSPITMLANPEARHDVYEMLGKHFQKTNKDRFGKKNTDEASLKIKTKVEWEAFLKGKLDGLKGVYSGEDDQLHKPELFRLAAFNKFTQQFALWHSVNTKSVRTAVE